MWPTRIRSDRWRPRLHRSCNEAEFGECRRYLPDRITVEADLTGPILRETLGAGYEELRDRRVLIDVPVGYCS